MKLGLSLLLFTVACATTGTPMEPREPASRAKVELDFAASPSERAVFPQARDPRMPTVDRLAHQLRAEIGDELTAMLQLCVAPSGQVTRVDVVEGTSNAQLDAAIVRDASEWQFASTPGSTAQAKLQTCERATVKYLVPR